MEVSRNPVYKYLTHNNNWPSGVALLWIGTLLVMCEVVIVIISIYLLRLRINVIFPALEVATVVTLGSVILFPSVALISTVPFAKRLTNFESMTILRTTPIPAVQITKGAIAGTVYHFRLLQVLGIGRYCLW